jgi:hypothetical protein
MMFGWKRKLKPVNPTQELASKVVGALNAAKIPCTLVEICNSNRYLSRQSAFRVKRMLDILVQDGRVKVLRKESDETGHMELFYFTKE